MTLMAVVSMIVFIIGVVGVRHLDKKEMRAERAIAWFFVIGAIFLFCLEVYDEMRKEIKKVEFGYSYGGRRWIIERNFGKGIGGTDLVYEVNEAGEKIGEGLRYKSSWRGFEADNISIFVPDDSRIQINDSTIIEFWSLAIPIEDRYLDPEKRKHLINNPDPAHIGILTEKCSLTNFLGGGYEHTTLEQVNRFTECCTPEHYRKLISAGDEGFVFKKKKGENYWDRLWRERGLKEEIRFAERNLDEAIRRLEKIVESYENE